MDDPSSINESDFKFYSIRTCHLESECEWTHELRLELDWARNDLIDNLVEKTIKFRLGNHTCLLVVDFVTSYDPSSSDDNVEEDRDNHDSSLDDEDDEADTDDSPASNNIIYYESVVTRREAERSKRVKHHFKIDLREFLPDLFCDSQTPYSVSCIKCYMKEDAPDSAPNRVQMDIFDDMLDINVYSLDRNVLFNDVLLHIEQGDSNIKRLAMNLYTMSLLTSVIRSCQILLY